MDKTEIARSRECCKETLNNQSMKSVYVDLDDVISTTTSTFIDIAEQEFGKKIRFEDIHSFDLKTSFQLSDREYQAFFNRIHQPETLLGFSPVDGAVDALTKWRDKGWQVAVVTGRPASTRDISLEWLQSHAVPFHSFTIVDKYGREDPKTNAAVTLDAFSRNGNYTFAVEDSWEMAVFLADTMNIPVALYNRPWNLEKGKNANIRRVDRWADIDPAEF